ncbi:T9SS type A sorting domain-containing protein [Aquimarina sp. SS2-1]|uniref:T9SS type A sorting domain-containing protein n=1 Tax=Aquimarina besae TaxID=3342247 RepID=UPI00366EDF0F
MKNLLLLVAALGSFGVINAQSIFFSEILTTPPGTDTDREYIELRCDDCTPGQVLDNIYVISVEGDKENTTGTGRIDYIESLDGLVMGANGFIVIATAASQASFTIDAGATIVTSTTPDIENLSQNWFIVQTTGDTDIPDTSDDLDSMNNGIIDDTTFLSWTILDSISLIDDDGAGAEGEAAYSSQIVISEPDNSGDANFSTQTGSNIFFLPLNPSGTSDAFLPLEYVARVGNSTGSTISDSASSDWLVANISSSGDFPNYTIRSGGSNQIDAVPQFYEGESINHIGSENIVPTILSVTEQELTDGISFFPNPTKNVVNINAKADIISSIEVIDATGKILVQKNNDLDVVDLSNLSAGLYYMNVYAEGARITKTLVKN